jgi:Holliday junction resolvase
MNSREKGKRGERQWRDELRANGYDARRGQQFSGSADSPDVVCEPLSWIHFEVKAVEKLNVQDAMDQARRDACRVAPGGGKVPIVAHKRNFREWLVTMTAEVFFRFLRGDFTRANRGNGKGSLIAESAETAEERGVPPSLEQNDLGSEKVPPTTTNNQKERTNEDKE